MYEKPIDVATKNTAAFFSSVLRSRSSVLEVGCGGGHLAAELTARGYDVVGVDSKPEAVDETRRRGVRATLASWPDYSGDVVDVVAFTRSLHHLKQLEQSIRKARRMVRSDGLLMVDEFAFDRMDESTLQWFVHAIRTPEARDLILPRETDLVLKLRDGSDPMEVWHKHHDRGLHTTDVMAEAIGQSFVIERTEWVPYLYRYLVRVLPETARAAAFIDDVRRSELHHTLIGWRIAAFTR